MNEGKRDLSNQKFNIFAKRKAWFNDLSAQSQSAFDSYLRHQGLI